MQTNHGNGRRQKLLALPVHKLSTLLGLADGSRVFRVPGFPADAEIVAVNLEPQARRLLLTVESEQFPVVPPGYLLEAANLDIQCLDLGHQVEGMVELDVRHLESLRDAVCDMRLYANKLESFHQALTVLGNNSRVPDQPTTQAAAGPKPEPEAAAAQDAHGRRAREHSEAQVGFHRAEARQRGRSVRTFAEKLMEAQRNAEQRCHEELKEQLAGAGLSPGHNDPVCGPGPGLPPGCGMGCPDNRAAELASGVCFVAALLG